jgi:ABC-2 type transport system permease protein
VLDTLRAHRVGAGAWVVFGSVANYFTALSLVHEMNRFPGGPKALATSMQPGVEAMRVLRWPADRLDTLGGYLTYHNLIFFSLFLSVYAGVQGARAVRGAEEGHALEEVLATGRSRVATILDLTLGFTAAMTLIALGLGLGTAAAMTAGDGPHVAGSLVALLVSGLCAMVAYALGLLVSQLVGTSRAAGGLTVLVLALLYVLTNLADEIGAAGVVRYASPFHYANESRALVPGHGFDVAASAVLLAMALVLLGAAAWAFDRRDYAAPLWAPVRRTPRTGPVQVSHASDRRVWTALVVRGRIGLLAWSVALGALALLWGSLLPTVMDVWDAFETMTNAFIGGTHASPEAQYLAFVSELVAPVAAAYVVTQAAGWVADLEQGRVEAVLSGPVSWTRLVVERACAAVVGVLVISTVAFMGLAAGILGTDARLSLPGVGRVLLGCALLGAAMAGLAVLAVAVLRSGLAVIALSVYLGASYILGLLVSLYGWPEWVNRLSVFGALGHPYLDWPPVSGLLVLLGLAVSGIAGGAALAERTPKVG